MPTATITITTIPTQVAGVPFTVSGTYQLSTSTWTDQLIYEDNNGAQLPITSPAVQLGISSFHFTNPGLPAGNHTVTVKDPLTGNAVTSNTFVVTGAQTIAITPPTNPVAGASFTFSGTLTGFTTAPALTYKLDGGTAVTLTGVTATTWSMPLTIPTSGTHTLSVSSGSVTSSTLTFMVAPATVNHVITPTTIGTVTAGAIITFVGTLTGYTVAPSLTYTISGGSPVSMTGVTAAGWSMQIIAPTLASTYIINVSDGTTSGSTTFTVSAAAKTITPIAPSQPVAGQSFTFTGTLSGYTTFPSLTYKLDGGPSVPMTGVSVTGWAMTITVGTAGSHTIVVTDGTVSGTVTFTVTAASTGATRPWYGPSIGGDGTWWVSPFQNSANWITSGALVTSLRNGNNGSPTGTINLPGNFSAPFYRGKATDPSVTVTDGMHTIVVHIPLGAIIETPDSTFDNSIGGLDETQPYLVWSISGATMNTGSVAASGSKITGSYGFTVMDGSGQMMMDIVTGDKGNANSFGGVTSTDLAALNASSTFVMQHKLAYSLDPNYQCSGAGPIWPLALVDTSGANVGQIPQGVTIGIPAGVARPTGQTRGFYAWFDCLQQYGAGFYNVAGAGATNFFIYDETGANSALVTDMGNSISAVMAYVCILNYANGVSGAQYSVATQMGAIPGSAPAFPPPALLDLSPTGGVNVAPSTFGAWYPNVYNVTWNNPGTGGGTTPPALSLAITTPVNVVVNTPFTFTGTLTGFTNAPTLTYSVNNGTKLPITGVTASLWSMQLTLTAAGSTVLSVFDATDALSSSITFTVSATTPTATPVTWNPSDIGGAITLSGSNYIATAGGSGSAGAAPAGVRATQAISTTAIVMWQVTFNAITQDCAVGVANSTFVLANNTGGLGSDANGIGFYPTTGTGSQPAQTVYYNNAQLSGGNGVTTVGGGVITVVTNGTNFWASDSAMRSTSGVTWNNSTSANPVTNTGGFSFSAIGSIYYPVFQTSEGGGIAVLNDGTSAFDAFGSSFLAANASVVTLSGQVTSGGGGTNPVKTITPNQPSGVVEAAPFTFTGTLTGYTTAPNLTYSVNGNSPIALGGVTATGWSTTLQVGMLTNTISVTDGTVTGSTTFPASAPGGGGTTGNRVVAPLTGSVTTGSWVFNQRLTVAAMPNGFMQYNYLLPAQYNTNVIYPVLFYGHTNDSGMNGGTYPNDGNSLINGESIPPITINQAFNTVAFRTGYPCIVVVPQCDQSINLGGSNPNANFGGYADSPNSGGNEQGINALLAYFKANFSVDPTRCYCTGDSLGAIGTLAWLVDNNAYNGVNKLWAGGFGLSDQLQRSGSNSAANVFSRMSGVPYMAGMTSSDNDEGVYDEAAWQSYTGNSNYPSPSALSSGGMNAIRSGTTQFYLVNCGSQDPWALYRQLNADGQQGTPIYTWLFSQISTGTVTASPTITGTTFTPASSVTANSPVNTVAGTLTAASSNGALTGVTFTLSSTTNFKIVNASVEFNSATVAAGSYPLTVSVAASNATNSPQTYPITVVVTGSGGATGVFSISGGKVIGPNGQPWVGKGVAIVDQGNSSSPGLSQWVTNAACQPLLTLFPHVNMVRLASYSYWAPSTYAQYINWLTARQIVVVIEDHTNSNGSNSGGGSGTVFTGSQLTNENNWYASLATFFKTNTYVWFGTDNEPSTNPSVAALSTWQQQTYNAIRGTGSNAIIEIEQANPAQQGANGGMTVSVYNAMKNIVMGPHYYSWPWNGQSNATSQATIYSSAIGSANSQWGGIVQQVATLQTITSQDGIVPCGCFEFGPATDGQSVDAAGNNCVNAVIQAVNAGNLFCYLAWWTAGGGPDSVANGTSSVMAPFGTAIFNDMNSNPPTGH